jgi:hypothetical protein
MIAALGAILSWIWRLLNGPRLPYGWSREFIASPAFLQTPEWKRRRHDALEANDGDASCADAASIMASGSTSITSKTAATSRIPV